MTIANVLPRANSLQDILSAKCQWVSLGFRDDHGWHYSFDNLQGSDFQKCRDSIHAAIKDDLIYAPQRRVGKERYEWIARALRTKIKR